MRLSYALRHNQARQAASASGNHSTLPPQIDARGQPTSTRTIDRAIFSPPWAEGSIAFA